MARIEITKGRRGVVIGDCWEEEGNQGNGLKEWNKLSAAVKFVPSFNCDKIIKQLPGVCATVSQLLPFGQRGVFSERQRDAVLT